MPSQRPRPRAEVKEAFACWELACWRGPREKCRARHLRPFEGAATVFCRQAPTSGASRGTGTLARPDTAGAARRGGPRGKLAGGVVGALGRTSTPRGIRLWRLCSSTPPPKNNRMRIVAYERARMADTPLPPYRMRGPTAALVAGGSQDRARDHFSRDNPQARRGAMWPALVCGIGPRSRLPSAGGAPIGVTFTAGTSQAVGPISAWLARLVQGLRRSSGAGVAEGGSGRGSPAPDNSSPKPEEWVLAGHGRCTRSCAQAGRSRGFRGGGAF